MVHFARSLIAIVFLGGACLIVLALPGMAWASADPSPLQTGLGLIAAALTATVALTITQDWRGQRADQLKAEQRQQRANAYAPVIIGIMKTFTAGEKAPIDELARDRATIALWAGTDTLAAVDHWQKIAHDITSNHLGDVPEDRRTEVQRAVAQVAIAARKDLGVDDLGVDDVASLLFDDFSPMNNPEAQS